MGTITFCVFGADWELQAIHMLLFFLLYIADCVGGDSKGIDGCVVAALSLLHACIKTLDITLGLASKDGWYCLGTAISGV